MLARKAISLRNIYDTIGDKPKKKSKNSKIIGVKSRKNFRRFNFLVKSEEYYSDPMGHIASVIYPKINIKDFIKDTGRRKRSPYNEFCYVWCSCPAWQYWGSAYYSTAYGYNIKALGEEDRFPDIRDPKGENLSCKHIIRVSKYMEHISFMRLNRRFKRDFERKLKKKGELRFASLIEMYPVVGEFLRRNKYLSYEVDEIIASLKDENVEDTLEKYGVLPEIDIDKRY